jgi:Mlc titration factor MtfA (ptsG expression regulator)
MRIHFAFIHYTYLFYACVAILVGWWLIIRLRRAAGIWQLRFYAFPRPWLKYLHQNVPLYRRLPLELRAPYQDKVVQFVDAKVFRPCGTMDEVTWAEQVCIAGNACLLHLNTDNPASFPRILTVQLYRNGDADAEARSSCIALWWDESKQQATDPRDNRNPALASIAAQLGWETAGKPALPDALLLAPWARAHTPDFEKAHPGILENAATGETAEIFAIAVEMFLNAPARLQQQRPELYERLRQFYRVDPARWKPK